MRGHDRADLGEHVGGRGEAQIGAEASSEFGGDEPVGASGARRRDPLRQCADATLDIGGGAQLLGETGGGEDDVRPLAAGIEQRVDADDGASAGEATGGKFGIGHIGERIGAEQHEHVDGTLGGGTQDAGGVAASCSGRGGPGL